MSIIYDGKIYSLCWIAVISIKLQPLFQNQFHILTVRAISIHTSPGVIKTAQSHMPTLSKVKDLAHKTIIYSQFR